MMALDEGATHVTAVERWLYLSLTCQQTLQANSFSPDCYTVVYKRPTDLALHRDVPNICNLLLCDIMDEGENASQMCKEPVRKGNTRTHNQVGLEVSMGDCQTNAGSSPA